MNAEQLFDLIEETVQTAVNQEPNQHVYVEREMRGTFPSLTLRVLPQARDKKPREGAKVISTQVIIGVTEDGTPS